MISEGKRKAIVERFGASIERRLAHDRRRRTNQRYMDDLKSVDTLLDFMVSVDPSQNSRYVEWLARRFAAGDFRYIEDVSKAAGWIEIFRNALPRLPVDQRDLNKHTAKSLGTVVQKIVKEGANISKAEAERQKAAAMLTAGEAVIYYDSDDIKIIIPKTREASQHFGRHTQWCTAAKSDNQFDWYNNQGNLYIVLFKKTNRRWQFHFESSQFMNERDEELSAAQLKKVSHLFKEEQWLRAYEEEIEDYVLAQFKNPSPETINRLLEINWMAIRLIKPSKQTPEQKLEAVKCYPMALRYIGKPTKKIIRMAIRHHGLVTLEHLPKRYQTPKIIKTVQTLSALLHPRQILAGNRWGAAYNGRSDQFRGRIMGSFLTRCCVTGQIIKDWQPVMILPIIQQSETYKPTSLKIGEETVEDAQGNEKVQPIVKNVYPPFDTTIYSHCFWQPFGRALIGKYADYGKFEIDETDYNKDVLIELFIGLYRYSYETLEGENQFHDTPFNMAAVVNDALGGIEAVKKGEVDWDQLNAAWEIIQESNHDNRIFVKHYLDNRADIPRLFQTAVISKAAWDGALQLAMNMQRSTHDVLDWPKIVEMTKAEAKQATEGDNTERERAARSMFLLERKFEMGLRLDSSYNPLTKDIPHRVVGRLMSGEDPAKVQADFQPIIDEVQALGWLEALGTRFVPHAYAGQDYSNRSGFETLLLALRAYEATQDDDDEFGDEDEELDETSEEFLKKSPEDQESARAWASAGRLKREVAELMKQLEAKMTEASLAEGKKSSWYY